MRPDGGEGEEEELRLGAAVLPLRLRIDQAVVEFLQVTLCARQTTEAAGTSCDRRYCGCSVWCSGLLISKTDKTLTGILSGCEFRVLGFAPFTRWSSSGEVVVWWPVG